MYILRNKEYHLVIFYIFDLFVNAACIKSNCGLTVDFDFIKL